MLFLDSNPVSVHCNNSSAGLKLICPLETKTDLDPSLAKINYWGKYMYDQALAKIQQHSKLSKDESQINIHTNRSTEYMCISTLEKNQILKIQSFCFYLISIWRKATSQFRKISQHSHTFRAWSIRINGINSGNCLFWHSLHCNVYKSA